ncbi:MAG TPA: hypothetical protein PKI01_12920 [Bacteroidales bacterium]|nr:hypothetical protein [Bacteroidales bacterium]
MILNNKLGKSFGPVGSFSGVILFVAGFVLTFFYISGLVLVLVGAFVGFSTESALVDPEKKRVRFSNNLFGIIRTGRWMNIEPGMKIKIKKSDMMWRTYSRGNRTLDIANDDFRLILIGSNNKDIMEIKKADSIDAAKLDVETLCAQLGLSSV